MVPLGIIAVVIDHVIPLGPLHCRCLLVAEASRTGRGDRDWTASRGCVGRASAQDEAGVPGHERLEAVVCFVFSIFCGP